MGLPSLFDQKELAERLFAMLDGRTTTLAPAPMEIDPSIYTDPEQTRRERATIFSQVPVIAAHSSEVAEPRDFVVVPLPNNETLITRQQDGSVRAFVNTCRHRAARLVEEPSGAKTAFACRYHGWSYNADGTLRNIAEAATFGEVDRSCLGLVELPAAERHGFVWVVDAPGAEIDVLEWLGPELDESLTAFGLQDYRCYRRADFDEAIDWKTLADGSMDYYHIPTTHARSVAPYFHNNIQIWDELGRHGRHISARRSIDALREAPPGDLPIEDHITVSHWIMPCAQLIRQPDHFQLLTMHPVPHAPNSCRLTIRLLTHRDAPVEDFARLWQKNWDILMAVLRDEDLALNRDLQKSMANTHVRPLVLGRNEPSNQSFHRWYRRALEDPHHPGDLA
jgi:phenylpropionate dioxygenase-like ring-hydroxylating dioxygenase large terminal subunit